MANAKDLVSRLVLAVVLLAGLFATRWDTTLRHFDFMTWAASKAVLDRGGNPWDAAELNAELASNPDRYGPQWSAIDADRFELHLLNPPTWIFELQLLGMSALAMSLVGAGLLFAAIVGLSRRQPFIEAFAYLITAGAVFYVSPSATTFRLGQTGFILAGLVGVRLLAFDLVASRVALALLSFKPHLALAAAAPEFIRKPSAFARSMLLPAVVLVAASIIAFGPGSWWHWLQELTTARDQGTTTDISIRTLAPGFALTSELGIWGIVIALAAIAMLSLRYQQAPPQLMTLASLALMAYLSGHAFSHDWLWLPLVPVVLRWGPFATVLSGFSCAAVYTAYASTRLDDMAVHPKSLLGLLVTVGLVSAVIRRRDPNHVGDISADDKTALHPNVERTFARTVRAFSASWRVS